MKTSRRMLFGRYDYAAFLTFFAYAAGSVVVPVALVDLARDLGFSLDAGGMTSGGALHLGRTIPMVGALLLCGFAAGRWGTRRVLGISVMFMGLGMFMCAWSPSYVFLLVALALAGLGEGVIEGLATPFVQDLHPDEPGRYINFSHAFWSVGVVVTVLSTGVLLTADVSWRTVIAVVSALGFAAGLLLMARAGPGQVYPDSREPRHWLHVGGQIAAIVRAPRFWIYFAAMFVAGGGEFCLTFWSASHIQLHYGSGAWGGGLGTAFFAAGMVLGRTGGGYLVRQHHLKHFILISGVAGTAVCLLLPSAGNLWTFFVLLFLAGVATAPFWPSIQSYATDRMPQADSTLLLILLSCAGVPGCGVFTYLMGYVANKGGDLTNAFYIVPACYAVLSVLMAADGLLPAPDRPQSPPAGNKHGHT